jgi:hypothetical protein
MGSNFSFLFLFLAARCLKSILFPATSRLGPLPLVSELGNFDFLPPAGKLSQRIVLFWRPKNAFHVFQTVSAEADSIITHARGCVHFAVDIRAPHISTVWEQVDSEKAKDIVYTVI